MVDVGDKLKDGVHWVSGHTGVPVLIVAAFALVVSWRIFKAGLSLVVQVILVTVILVVATKMGWIHF